MQRLHLDCLPEGPLLLRETLAQLAWWPLRHLSRSCRILLLAHGLSSCALVFLSWRRGQEAAAVALTVVSYDVRLGKIQELLGTVLYLTLELVRLLDDGISDPARRQQRSTSWLFPDVSSDVVTNATYILDLIGQIWCRK